MLTNFMEENDMFNVDSLIPTTEEFEKTLKHITQSGEISFEDYLVLFKIKFINKIIKNKC